MANYLASDGLHLDNVGHTSSGGTSVPIYGCIYSESNVGGGTWIAIEQASFQSDDEDDYLRVLLDRGSSSYHDMCIRLV